MLYIAECRFTDPVREAAWNEWYGGRRLDELLSVPGFRTSQRFKAVTPVVSPYLAIHSIDGVEVFARAEYRAMSGGGFQEWQRDIADWRRNLFTGLDVAPAVATDEYLAMTDRATEVVDRSCIRFIWLTNAGLDRSVPLRGIARVGSRLAKQMIVHPEPGIAIYVPLAPQKSGRSTSTISR